MSEKRPKLKRDKPLLKSGANIFLPKEKQKISPLIWELTRSEKFFEILALTAIACTNWVGTAGIVVYGVVKLAKHNEQFLEEKEKESQEWLKNWQKAALSFDKKLRSQKPSYPILKEEFSEIAKFFNLIDFSCTEISSYEDWQQKRLEVTNRLSKNLVQDQKELHEKRKWDRIRLAGTFICSFLAVNSLSLDWTGKTPVLTDLLEKPLEAKILPVIGSKTSDKNLSIREAVIDPAGSYIYYYPDLAQQKISNIIASVFPDRDSTGQSVTALTNESEPGSGHLVAKVERSLNDSYLAGKVQKLTNSTEVSADNKITFTDKGPVYPERSKKLGIETLKKIKIRTAPLEEMKDYILVTDSNQTRFSISPENTEDSENYVTLELENNYSHARSGFPIATRKVETVREIIFPDSLKPFLNLQNPVYPGNNQIKIPIKNKPGFKEYKQKLNDNYLLSDIPKSVQLKIDKSEVSDSEQKPNTFFYVLVTTEQLRSASKTFQGESMVIDNLPLAEYLRKNYFPNKNNADFNFENEGEANKAVKIIQDLHNQRKIKLKMDHVLTNPQMVLGKGLIDSTSNSRQTITFQPGREEVVPISEEGKVPKIVYSGEKSFSMEEGKVPVYINTEIPEEIKNQMFNDLMNSPNISPQLKEKLEKWRAQITELKSPKNAQNILLKSIILEEVTEEIKLYIQQTEYGQNNLLNKQILENKNSITGQIEVISRTLENKEKITCHPAAFAFHVLLAASGWDSVVISGFLNEKDILKITSDEAHAYTMVKGVELGLFRVDPTPFRDQESKTQFFSWGDIWLGLKQSFLDLETALGQLSRQKQLPVTVLIGLMGTFLVFLKMLDFLDLALLSQKERQELINKIKFSSNNPAVPLSKEDRSFLRQVLTKLEISEKKELQEKEIQERNEKQEKWNNSLALMLLESAFYAKEGQLFQEPQSFIQSLKQRARNHLLGQKSAAVLDNLEYRNKLLDKISAVDIKNSLAYQQALSFLEKFSSELEIDKQVMLKKIANLVKL